MKIEKICGIYKIENLVNGKVYVGQSINIKTRFMSHKSELKSNNHSNIHLQNSWNKYGEENFKFEILEECNFDNLNNLEKEWISKLNSINPYGYNLEYGGKENKNISEYTRVKMKESKSGVNHPFYGVKFTDEHKQILRESKTTNIPILQFDLDGKLTKRWEYGAGEASKKLNIGQSGIFKCFKMIRKTYKGYIWLYEKYYNEFSIDLNFHLIKKGKNIVQLSKENEFLCIWDSIKEAQEILNIRHISEVCRNNNNAGGFKWMYKEDYEKYIEEQNKSV